MILVAQEATKLTAKALRAARVKAGYQTVVAATTNMCTLLKRSNRTA